jgi:uncharacterized protein YegP (UPF0339 family)
VSDPIYRADDGWRWQLRARNGEIVDASTESFTERRHAVENMRLAKAALTEALTAFDIPAEDDT